MFIQDGIDNVLLLQHSKSCGMFPEWWEFPGGKIDLGESPSEAVVREVVEETGIRVSLPDPLSGVVIGVPEGTVQYTFFACTADPKRKWSSAMNIKRPINRHPASYEKPQ